MKESWIQRLIYPQLTLNQRNRHMGNIGQMKRDHCLGSRVPEVFFCLSPSKFVENDFNMMGSVDPQIQTWRPRSWLQCVLFHDHILASITLDCKYLPCHQTVALWGHFPPLGKHSIIVNHLMEIVASWRERHSQLCKVRIRSCGKEKLNLADVVEKEYVEDAE